MKDAVIPYTLPEEKDHSFFFIAQHVEPHVEAKMHRHEAWELYYVTQGRGMRMTSDTLMTFSRFLTLYRLSTACELLCDTKKQVSEICFAVGFNDLPHFNRVFKKEYGMSPSLFRQSKR